MRHFLYYLEHVCLGTAPGIASGYKPDGTIFHHGGYIRNYQKVALYTLARILRLLSGTVFEPSSALHARIRAILETEYAFSCGVYEPFCLAQYAFQPDNASSVSEFADTAIATQDEVLARQYVALARSSSREMLRRNICCSRSADSSPRLPIEAIKRFPILRRQYMHATAGSYLYEATANMSMRERFGAAPVHVIVHLAFSVLLGLWSCAFPVPVTPE